MSEVDTDALRTWVFDAKGPVQFKGISYPLATDALKCLGKQVGINVSFEIAPHLLGRTAEDPISVEFDIKSCIWRQENGDVYDVEIPEIRQLAERALDRARDRLNTELTSVFDIHMGLSSVYPTYATQPANDRPRQTESRRSWRSSDAAWIKARIVPQEGLFPPRDVIDRALDLVKHLNRPVQMQWVYFGHHDGAHRIALRFKKHLHNPVISLKRNRTQLVLDRDASVLAVDTRAHVACTQMIALVQALRRYAGLDLGDLEVGAYQVLDFEETNKGMHVLSLFVDAVGWGHAVGQASRMTSTDLLSSPPLGVRFERPSDARPTAAASSSISYELKFLVSH